MSKNWLDFSGDSDQVNFRNRLGLGLQATAILAWVCALKNALVFTFYSFSALTLGWVPGRATGLYKSNQQPPTLLLWEEFGDPSEPGDKRPVKQKATVVSLVWMSICLDPLLCSNAVCWVNTNTHKHSILTAIFPGELGLACCPLILVLVCILLG